MATGQSRGGPEAGSIPDLSLPASLTAAVTALLPEESSAGAPAVRPPVRINHTGPRQSRNLQASILALSGCLAAAILAWNLSREAPVCQTVAGTSAASVVGGIVMAESGGVADAKNAYSSATGAGQFVDGTWLDLIKRHRPDLRGQSDTALLALRNDPALSRDMVQRYAEKNAAMLSRNCLPVTAGTLYLSHFAGGAGAVAVLSAPENADAATVMADADARGFITRAMIVTANPFLRNYTVADLKRWADRKMGLL